MAKISRVNYLTESKNPVSDSSEQYPYRPLLLLYFTTYSVFLNIFNKVNLNKAILEMKFCGIPPSTEILYSFNSIYVLLQQTRTLSAFSINGPSEVNENCNI